MYGKCCQADRARLVFDALGTATNIFSWTSMLGAYQESDRVDEAFEMFGSMLLQGDPHPDEVTLVIMLNACRSRSRGEFVLECVDSLDLGTNQIVANAAVTMLGRCGELDRAWMLFQAIVIEERNVVSWTTMAMAFARSGHPLTALEIFQSMQLQGVRPNFHTLSALIHASSQCHDLFRVLSIHGAIEAEAIDVTNLVVGNALISAYAKIGYLDDARTVFDRMLHRDSISWNAIISGYSSWDDHPEALDLFRRLQLDGHRPTSIALVAAMESCSTIAEAETIHSGIYESGLESSTVVGTTVVAAYGRLGHVDAARRAFSGISGTDGVTWNALLTAYSYSGRESLEIFRNMLLHGAKPVTVLTFLPLVNSVQGDEVVKSSHLLGWIEECGCGNDEMLCASVISMHARLGQLERAQELFERHVDASPRPAAWNAVVAANTQHQNAHESVRLWRRMLLQGVTPDRTSFVSAASALSSTGSGKFHDRTKLQLEAMAMSAGFGSDEMVATSLIAMFGKSGNLDEAWRIFSTACEHGHGVVCWNSTVSVFAQHRQLGRCLRLVRTMQQEGWKADEMTLSIALAAYSHSGLIDDAHGCFASMVADFGVTPVSQHYTCMIDVLGRAGMMNRLKSFLRSGGNSRAMDSVAWTALLTACWNHSDVELAMLACDRILEMSPKQSSALVMLYNTHTQNVSTFESGSETSSRKTSFPMDKMPLTSLKTGSYLSEESEVKMVASFR